MIRSKSRSPHIEYTLGGWRSTGKVGLPAGYIAAAAEAKVGKVHWRWDAWRAPLHIIYQPGPLKEIQLCALREIQLCALREIQLSALREIQLCALRERQPSPLREIEFYVALNNFLSHGPYKDVKLIWSSKKKIQREPISAATEMRAKESTRWFYK